MMWPGSPAFRTTISLYIRRYMMFSLRPNSRLKSRTSRTLFILLWEEVARLSKLQNFVIQKAGQIGQFKICKNRVLVHQVNGGIHP